MNGNVEPDYYERVLAAFRQNGTTLRHWCREHGVNPTSARHALTGYANGPRSFEIRRLVAEALARLEEAA